MQGYFMRTTMSSQTDLNLRWAHMSKGTFSEFEAHLNEEYERYLQLSQLFNLTIKELCQVRETLCPTVQEGIKLR